MNHKTAIVGFGCAGYHGAKALRKHGYQGEIDVYTDTLWVPANPMLTTYYVGGKLDKEGTLPFGRPEDIAKRYDLKIGEERVKKLISEERKLLFESGETKVYDQILISTGALPFMPSIPGIFCKNVFPMRTMEDAEQLKVVLENEKIQHAVVVGASMVGIKMVELFHMRGIKCTLVDMASVIFPVSAVPIVAHEIERRLKHVGVEFMFGKSLREIREMNGKRQVVFSDGGSIACEVVMMCIGTRANTKIVDDDIHINRGIVVDSTMKTNIPGIYAAGDCCEGINLMTGETQTIGIWDNAARQGETAGANMAGKHTIYQGNILHNITHFMGMDFISYGDVRAVGDDYFYENKEKRQMFFVRVNNRKPVCMNFIDSYGASGVLKAYMLRKLDGSREGLSSIERVRMIKEGIPEPMIDCLMKI